MKISHYIFIFKFILLNIFYSLSLYDSTNVIIPLECYQFINAIWLGATNHKKTKMMLYGWSHKSYKE